MHPLQVRLVLDTVPPGSYRGEGGGGSQAVLIPGAGDAFPGRRSCDLRGQG